MTRKYLLVPGRVVSQTDGDHHFVTSLELAALYGVEMVECLVFHRPCMRPYETPEEMAKAHDLIVLRPRYDGNYHKPLTEQETENG